MKYMLLIYSNESLWEDEEKASCMARSLELCKELEEEGVFLGASPLESVTTATSIRLESDAVVTTDGPFAETREQLAGYFIIEVEDLDQALATAKRIPSLYKSTVEIRPIHELDGLFAQKQP